MKKIIIALTFILFLTINSTNVFALTNSTSKTRNGKIYTVNATNTTVKINTIPNTNTKHTKGISTNINISRSYSKSQSSSSSLTVNADAYFVSVANTIGISNSTTATVSTGQGYTIPASNNSGYYRMQFVFPGSKVVLGLYTLEPSLIGSKTIYYAPDYKDHYVRINKYA